MVKAIGIDIVEIDRIKNVIDKWGDRFLRKVYTPWEINYCREKAYPEYSFAARFAVKEAVFKALGGGTSSGIKWTNIEVVNHKSGKPSIKMGGRVKEIVGGGEILISISHSHKYAIAQALLIEK